MANNGDDELKKKFEEMDRKVKRLRAMLPVEFSGNDDDRIMEALAGLDDDQFATMEMISEEISATVADMEKLLCGR